MSIILVSILTIRYGNYSSFVYPSSFPGLWPSLPYDGFSFALSIKFARALFYDYSIPWVQTHPL